MKKLYIFFFLVLPFFLQAQITITASDLPQAGDVISSVNCDVPPNFSIGSAGANQSYDFSGLIQLDTTVTSFVNVSGTAGASEFPNATLASDEDGDFIYYEQTSDAFFLVGFYIDTSTAGIGQFLASPFDPPQKIFEIPTTFNTSFVDNNAFTLTIAEDSGLADSIRTTTTFTNDVLVDGYGTITTPDGTFDCLRERRYQTTTSTTELYIAGMWTPFGIPITFNDTTYNWYANNSSGPMASATIENGIVVGASYNILSPNTAAPLADFSFVTVTGASVDFTDESTNSPTSWAWDFGDGNTSTMQNPSHTFAATGNYNVCLTASNSAGSNTSCQMVFASVVIAPVANFSVTTVTGSSFDFTDESTNNPTSWMWDFGDGNTSTMQNPSHTFAATGDYNVCLTVTNSAGSNTTCTMVAATVVVAPVASFSVTTVTGSSFDFTDESTNDPTSWMWDFGDGNTSTMQNPSHTFTATGDYNVCLTVTNSAGSNTTCTMVAATVVVAPVASFSFTTTGADYTFTDESTNTPTDWAWDFGDSNTSTDQNPQHTFTTSGMFNVCLTVSNSAGSNTSCQMIDVMITSTEEINESISMNIFPNPVKDVLNIQLENQNFEQLQFQLFNSIGQVVLEKTIQSNGIYDVDVKNIPSEMYYYILTDQDGNIRNRGSVVKGN
ncbi:MAG: PKD domain-containing protein [Bacteroidota bacterium]